MAATTETMTVTQQEFTTGQENFLLHYYLKGCDSSFEGNDISIPFTNVYGEIEAFKSDNDFSDDQVGLRIVLCYDKEERSLYYRVQLCQLVPTNQTDDGCKVYRVTSPYKWFELRNDSLQPTDNTELFDTDYLDSFYYTAEGPCTGGERLSDDAGEEKYVRCLVFPWGFELLRIYTDNGGEASNTDDFSIHFAAYSRDVTNGDAGVQFPQSIAVYVVYRDNPEPLNDTIYPGQPFRAKAGDMSTLCPPKCDSYVLANAT